MWYGGSIAGAFVCIDVRFTLTSSSRLGLCLGLQYCFQFDLVMASSNTRSGLRPPSATILDLVGIHFPLGCALVFLTTPHDRFIPESPRWLISKGLVCLFPFALLSLEGWRRSTPDCRQARPREYLRASTPSGMMSVTLLSSTR